jgi:hypothetical protein
MAATDKRSLISESVIAIQIDIHPAGEEPDRHVVRVTPWVSRMTTVRKALLSQTWIPAPEMKSWPSAIVQPNRHPGLPHSPSNKAPWSSEVWFGKVVTGLLDLPAHIKPDMRSVQVKTCHQDQNDAVLNRHRWGLPPWNLEIATTLSPLFPSESSTFVYLPRPVTSTIHEHKHSLYSCNHNSF